MATIKTIKERIVSLDQASFQILYLSFGFVFYYLKSAHHYNDQPHAE